MPERGWPLSAGYRIDLFAAQDAIRADDVIALWEREGVLAGDEARRRVGEVLLIATDQHGEPVGVSSTYLQRNDQLGMDLWYYRAFVAKAHRMSEVAVSLAVIGREVLQRRFTEGEDRRAAGIIYEVENEGLKTYFHWARWIPAEFLFIGENARGDHVRVFYFPGAMAPQSSGAAGATGPAPSGG